MPLALRELVWAALLVCAIAAPVVADSDPEPPQYRATIEAAVSEYDSGNFIEARALFSRAHAVFPNARTYRGLGMIEFELRNYVESVRLLELALADRRRELPVDLREASERLLERAKAFVARLKLQVTPASALVTLSGAPVPPAQPDGALLLQAGDYVIEAQAKGFLSARREVRLIGGETQELSLSLVPVASAEKPAQTENERPARKLRWLWIGLGAIAVGAAVALPIALTRHTREEPKPAYGGSANVVFGGP